MNGQIKITVVVIGLEFGAEFVPIYLDHPDVESVAICDKDEKRFHTTGERLRPPSRSLEAIDKRP